MIVEIYRKQKHELTRKEFMSCYNLNLGAFGEMRARFLEEFEKNKATVVLCKYRGKIIGWAFLFSLSCYYEKSFTAHFYVGRKHRRRGVGKLLRSEISRIIKERKIKCSYQPHDAKSTAFLKVLSCRGKIKRKKGKAA